MLALVRFCLFALGAIVLNLALHGAPVQAETPSFVAEQTADDGVYAAPGGLAIDEEAMSAVVERALEQRLKLSVVAPRDAQPDNEAFALRVRQAAESDATLVFDSEGAVAASVSDDFRNSIGRALENARAAATPETAADAFVTALTTEPERPLPDVIKTFIKATIYLLVLLLLAALAEYMWRRWKRGRAATS